MAFAADTTHLYWILDELGGGEDRVLGVYRCNRDGTDIQLILPKKILLDAFSSGGWMADIHLFADTYFVLTTGAAALVEVSK